MSSIQSLHAPDGKAKMNVGNPPSTHHREHSGPTTFFLKTGKELEREQQKATQRGRKASRSSVVSEEPKTPNASTVMSESSFGVQSLEDTINWALPAAENALLRTASNSSELSSMAGDDPYATLRKQRRAGNRVHPTILATGQRILSSERSPSQRRTVASPPTLSTDSPRRRGVRRSSATSSINMSQPLTPIRLSPHPASATPSTPRSASPKSFRLSDEEVSVASGSLADESNSQAIFSDDEDHNVRPVPRIQQLVMPSLAMPSRRPFTEQGRQMGRAKIMVLGPKGIGKSSFINSVFRNSEHIVHVDQVAQTSSSRTSLSTNVDDYSISTTFTEILASTRPYPSWWTDAERSRSLHRRSSVGEGVLERNLTFIDTPSLDDDDSVQRVLDHVKLGLRRASSFESLSDSEIVGLLGGEGGVQIDAVMYLFDPTPLESVSPVHWGTMRHAELLQCLCAWTNFIPLIGRADTVTPEQLAIRKTQIVRMLDNLKSEPYQLSNDGEDTTSAEPFAISSALIDDAETIDASILMSSQYLQPLAPSELGRLTDLLLTPHNIARMRHESATKFVTWRQENLQALITRSCFLRSQSPGVTSTGSLLEDPSKVLVPHSTSSYYRSASPDVSDISALAGNAVGASEYALAKYNEQSQPSEPFRQVRIAKWAQELKRSLDNERRKYIHMYTTRSTTPSSAESEKQLMPMHDAQRPKAGRLGGDLGIIDPRDPLGVLAFAQTFRRRGFVLLQVVGGCGLIGAVAYWVMRNWADVQDYFGIPQSTGMISATAVPAPTEKSTLADWLNDSHFRSFFGWTR
ncbi:hypothetical protein DOTSEDRAFT_67494 [Dothistroma septosporum NZE10]|uniref:Septin-type G domain-containing protein n=1 Tax=Dothistroma septosporum (strain NZE10 / CBS 128990) TaxID=675120 RepID=N1PZN9_DOTSN|nr:hypothetical protein DOTSEDRAFT_67494 [Dothistroma septosporum NZE10]